MDAREMQSRRSLLETIALEYYDIDKIREGYHSGYLPEDVVNMLLGWHSLPYSLVNGDFRRLSFD